LFGPAKLPAPIAGQLNRELNTVLRDAAVWQKLQAVGISNEGGTPRQLTAFIKAETQRVRTIVNQAVTNGASS
jgi:tripartite-type tricarboxylate transporter receptor subunit TctC